MKRTFATEDERKTKLFESWIFYLTAIHRQFVGAFEEIYEGLVTVSDLSKNRIGFHLEDGRKLRHIPISPDINANTCRLDCMYVVLGRKKDRWWPLDVISIGSIIGSEPEGLHMTINPLLNNSDLHKPISSELQ